MGVMDRIKSSIEEKTRKAHEREGALLGLASLCERLGRLFEPYVIHVLPLLISSFADQDKTVRMAAEDCSR